MTAAGCCPRVTATGCCAQVTAAQCCALVTVAGAVLCCAHMTATRLLPVPPTPGLGWGGVRAVCPPPLLVGRGGGLGDRGPLSLRPLPIRATSCAPRVPGSEPARCQSSGLTLAGMARVSARLSHKVLRSMCRRRVAGCVSYYCWVSVAGITPRRPPSVVARRGGNGLIHTYMSGYTTGWWAAHAGRSPTASGL